MERWWRCLSWNLTQAMITLELTQDELQALAGLLDAGVKATGLSGVKAAAALLVKLEAAAQQQDPNTEEAAQ